MATFARPFSANALVTSLALSSTLNTAVHANEFQPQYWAAPVANAVLLQRANFNPNNAYHRYVVPVPVRIQPVAYMRPQAAPRPAPHYAARTNIWQRISRNYQLGDHAQNPQVQRFIRQYTANPAAMNQLVLRASQYLHIIIEEAERRNIPSEIALLPLVESGFTPNASSGAGAAGLWQFMPKTGNTYGLIRNAVYDGRLDSFAATGAALNYLESLSREFKGDWMLALAAYNAGPNRVHTATGSLRRLGQRISYWNLPLPKETADYVPRLLAFKEIISHPEYYGVRLPNVPDAPMLAQMRINKPVDLRQAAIRAGLRPDALTELNPYFRSGVTTPQYSNRIILPRQHAPNLVQIIHALPPVGANFAMNQWR